MTGRIVLTNKGRDNMNNDKINEEDGLSINDYEITNKKPRYKIADRTKCDPFNYACDKSCDNKKLCLFNPSSICYNSTMEDFKKFIHNMSEFQEYYLHELNRSEERRVGKE